MRIIRFVGLTYTLFCLLAASLMGVTMVTAILIAYNFVIITLLGLISL